MVENAKDQEDHHHGYGAWGGLDAEETDQADDGEVATDCNVLQGARVNETFRVNVCGVDI